MNLQQISLEPKYNIQKIADSSLGQKRSEKTKAKISEALKRKNHPLFGKTFSVEAKTKMSLAKSGDKNLNFGKARSAETKAKMSTTRGTTIYVYSKNGSLVNTFSSAR